MKKLIIPLFALLFSAPVLARTILPAPITGQLLDPDGHPSVNTKICLCTRSLMVWYPALPIEDPKHPDHAVFTTTTDATGHFSFPAPTVPADLLVFTDKAYLIAKTKTLTFPATLQLTRWASLGVTVTLAGKPAPAGISLRATYDFINDELGPYPNFTGTTDAHGHVTFKHILVGNYALGRASGNARSIPVEVKSGQSNSVELPIFQTVTGHIVLPAEVRNQHCFIQADLLDRRVFPHLTLPPNILQMTADQQLAWFTKWQRSTSEGIRMTAQAEVEKKEDPRYTSIQEDHAFSFGDLRAGTHYMRAQIFPLTQNGADYDHPLATVVYTLTIPHSKPAEFLTPLDLGTLAPSPAYALNAGQPVPDVTFQTPDGHMHRLSDYRGKLLFLDVWGTWCGVCIHDLPNVKAIHDTFAANPHFAMLSLSAGDTPQVWQQFLHQHDLPWTQACLGPFDQAWQTKVLCVNGYPTYLLISPDGTLLAEGFQSTLLPPVIKTNLEKND